MKIARMIARVNLIRVSKFYTSNNNNNNNRGKIHIDNSAPTPQDYLK